MSLDTLLLGEAETARILTAEALEEAATHGDYDRTKRAIQSSVRAYQPSRVSNSPTSTESRAFLDWVQGRVGDSSFERIKRIDGTYRDAAIRAGLMSVEMPSQMVRGAIRDAKSDMPMSPGLLKYRMMQDGFGPPR